LERCDTGLTFQIALGEGQQHTNRRICWACAVNGHVVAAPPISVMKSRRFMPIPKDQNKASYRLKRLL
jgi:hypothetical protein